jgi:hypothetical protein
MEVAGAATASSSVGQTQRLAGGIVQRDGERRQRCDNNTLEE